MARPRRSEETRAAESRMANKREVLTVNFESALRIPENIVPPGMVYKWVAASVLNEPNHPNWNANTRVGWRPVPRDRHLDQFPYIPIPGYATDSSAIINGGLILCEAPREIVDQIKAHNEQETEAQMNSIKWSVEGMQGAPTFSESGKVQKGHLAFKQE